MKAVLAGIALCLGSLTANAALVEFNFTATLKSPLDAGAGPWLQNVSAGTIGTGSLVFDTSVPNVPWLGPNGGAYAESFTGAFAIGGITLTVNGTINVDSYPSYFNKVEILSTGGSATGIDPAWGFRSWEMVVRADNTDTVPDVSIPDDFDFPSLTVKTFTFAVENGGPWWVATLELTSLERVEANAVPEPASFALVGAGLLGIAALRRRRVERR